MPLKDNKATPETALAQVLVAFGHGIGGLHISHSAAKAGLDRFRPVIEKSIAEWDSNLPSLLAYATTIGRVTAHQTLSRGTTTVTSRDVLEALKRIEEQREEQRIVGFGGCPFFHGHP
jgi:hypothetical protein